MFCILGSGKSAFIKDLIRYKDQMFSPKIERTIYCFSEPIQTFPGSEGIQFHQGFSEDLISREKLPEGQTLLVLDDLSDEIPHRTLARLFTKLSHHRRISVFFIGLFSYVFCNVNTTPF